MSTVTLPADTVWLDDGRLGVAIVQGDSAQPETLPDDYDVLGLFVAPASWAQYDKPCDPSVSVRRDGRQVWTVRRPVRRNLADDPTPGWEWSADELLRATIQVVPVVAPDDAYFTTTLAPTPHVVIHAGAAWLVESWHVDTIGKEPHLPLDPLPTPGQFAVIIRTVGDGWRDNDH